MKRILVIIFLISLGIKSQTTQKGSLEFVEVGSFIHSISLPFKASNGFIALNRSPGIRISTSFPINENTFSLAYRLALSFYHQKGLHYGLHLNNQIALCYGKLSFLTPEIQLGLGYLHIFQDAPLYKFENGGYKRKKDWGRSQLTGSLALGFKIRISEKARLDLTLAHQIVLQFPFAPKADVFGILHNNTYIGLRKKIR
ncbi:MAG: hypothetical protein AAGA43_11105 [Bacteroidota bacterium]